MGVDYFVGQFSCSSGSLAEDLLQGDVSLVVGDLGGRCLIGISMIGLCSYSVAQISP